MRRLKLIVAIITLLAVAIACSTQGQTEQNNPPIEDSGSEISQSTPTATLSSPTNTPQPEPESQTAELPPQTFEELLETGIESGMWTEAEGLVMFLKYFAGEVEPGELTGVEDVVLPTGSGIIRLADNYLTQPDADPESVAELQRLLRKLHPPQEVLDAISQPYSQTGLSSPAKLAALSNPAPKLQTEQDCINLINGGYDPEEIQGKICLYSRERVITLTTTLRVYFPIWAEDFAEFDLDRIENLLNRMEKPALAYDKLNGLTVKNFSILYIPWEILQLNIPISANIDSTSDSCLVELNSNIFILDHEETINQHIALEMFNCVARWTWSDDDFYSGSQGAPYYFSNTVYPEGDLERAFLPHFDQQSAFLPIFELGPANFVFYQWLGNVYNPQQVVNFLHEYDDPENMGSYIAPGSPGDFTRFVVSYLSQGIADEDTGRYFVSPSPPTVSDTITVDKVSELQFDSENLIAARFFVDYKKEKRFLQEYGIGGTQGRNFSAVEAKLHQNLSAWSGLPPEIRSSCKQDVRYLYVAPHIFAPNMEPARSFKIDVTKVEQAVCDPCLLGAWQIDNDSFDNYMTSIFDTYVPQAANFTTTIGGNYFMQFDTEGKVQAQREGMVVYVYLETDFTVQPTLNPTNPGPQQPQQVKLPVYTSVVINSNGIGNYSTDGEFLKVTQFVDILKDVSTGDILIADPTGYVGGLIPVGMMFEFGAEYSSQDGPDPNETVLYACQGDTLDLFMNETDATLRLNRIEKILPTPVPTPNPTPNAQAEP